MPNRHTEEVTPVGDGWLSIRHSRFPVFHSPQLCRVAERPGVWYAAAVKSARYIVVEGPIGVGKTTLARLLAEEFHARPVLEQVEENPFLKKFYEDPGANAFQTQLFFLLSRYRQQRLLAQQDLFNQGT